jgi:RNase P/RNase MRP subunit POP5
MAHLVYGPEFPEEVKPPYEALFKRHAGLLPDWCDRLTVYFTDGGGQGTHSASSSTDYEYRRASHYLYVGWLKDSEAIREADIVHEFFHVLMSPAHDYGLAELKILLGKATEEHRKSVIDQYRNQCEAVVEDLTNLYLKNRLALPPGSKLLGSIDRAAK